MTSGLKVAWELHPELMRKNAVKAGRRMHELHPNYAREFGRKYGPKGGSKGGCRVHELYPAFMREVALWAGHVRWHVHRGVANPKCRFCTGTRGPKRGWQQSMHIRLHVRRGIHNPQCTLCVNH